MTTTEAVKERGLREDLKLKKPRGGRMDKLPKSVDVFNDWFWMDVKLDGVRMTLELRSGKKNLLVGRNRKNKKKGVDRAGPYKTYTEKVPAFANLAIPSHLDGTVLDGELIFGNGANDASGLIGSKKVRAKRLQAEKGIPEFHVFDIIFKAGKDTRELPLKKREQLYKEVLDQIAPSWMYDTKRIKDSVDEATFDRICNQGYEGVVFKQPTAVYGKKWYKLKARETVDGYVVDVTEGKSGGSPVNDVKPKPDGTASTLTVAVCKNGEDFEVAKVGALPDKVEEDAYKNFEDYENRVMEFTASRWDGERFTWPRFSRWRPEKEPHNCQYDEQVERFK